ncbi:MAG: PilZ domain-containing protein [Nitrospinales bacterium]
MDIEKRKYVRFLPQPNAYAALGSSYTKIGKIRDISMGGLAFEYYCGSEDLDQYDSTVTVFITVNSFYLENIPCRMISDQPKSNSNKASVLSANYMVKQCGLQFMNISEDQRQRLEYFLNNHTQGIAPSAVRIKNLAEFA